MSKIGRVEGESYRYGFNGHESIDELAGQRNTYDFGARMYESRLGRFMSIDPWDDKYPWQTPYAYFKNSPISTIDWMGFGDSTHIDDEGNVIAEYDDGDDGVYHHSSGTTKEDIDGQRNDGEFTGGDGNYIGELGGTLDLTSNGIFVNKLASSANEALSEDFTFIDWFDSVKGGGKWDLKSNTNTIWGVAWRFDQNRGVPEEDYTEFTYDNGLTFNSAADVGNYHAGFTGSMFGVPVPFQVIGAGTVEQVKDMKSGDFHQFANQYWGAAISNLNLTRKRGFWMDEEDDYYWNTAGMTRALFLKENLKLGPDNPLMIQKQ